MNTKLETVTGMLVDIQNPDASTISIDDIAWGLSRLPRFCGQTITTVPYNVAQHSIFVMNEVQAMIASSHPVLTQLPSFVAGINNQRARNELLLKALLHDAAEAYTGDWPSPVKRLPVIADTIKEIEDRLLFAIYDMCNLTELTDDERHIIKYADKIAQKIEAYAFMPSRGLNWIGLPSVTLEQLQSFPAPETAWVSYNMFLEKYKELT